MLPSRLSRSASFYLLASIIMFFLAASSVPTPLYAIYQARWDFSPITVTVIFGIYALAVLVTLLTVGSLSDHVGRRPVLLAAIALPQAAAMVVFTTAQGLPALVAARIIQGLSTGAALGAVGAGMLDIDRAKGTIANSVGPMSGTATGGLIGGLFVQYLPAPTHLVYLVLLGIFALQAVGVLLMPETSLAKPGALASLKPQFRLPPVARRPFLLAAPALVAAWSLPGLYGSLGPTLLRRLAGSPSLALGGLAIFVLAASAGLTVLALRNHAQRTLMIMGTAALVTGVGITLVSISARSVVLFFVGSAVAGMGFGAGFQGSIRSVLPLAAPDQRAGVLSVLFLVSYLAMGIPAVIAGVLVVYGHGGIFTTAREYGVAVMVLASAALLGSLLQRRPVNAVAAVSTTGSTAPSPHQSAHSAKRSLVAGAL